MTGLFIGATIDDATSQGNDSFDFTPSAPIVINDINKTLSLVLYDEDLNDTLEFMGGWDFKIYQANLGFPSVLTVGSAIDDVSFELTLTYEF